MDPHTYKRKLFKALDALEGGASPDYWEGYLKGLERRHSGGTGLEHLEGVLAGIEGDLQGIEFGEGYREGFGY